ncbi:MAG: hypothetical protein B5766_04790 [Candidatus Lumbricidophila eiseniae]|uniref:DUF2142 domain-containing protein n=1 Tax=Candidatus Lumbricidiphila eiseniae TaxID=1969409 RepID=A0A2A6FTL7_9MICO|nr:MAG: hypothetical protein B5766_04790 [Candidatus Lumbricidophila eiseniae]
MESAVVPVAERQRASSARLVTRYTWVMFVIATCLGVLWSLASPVFGVPDEASHFYKGAAQVRGQVIGKTVPGIKHIVVDVPPGDEYSPNLVCFAFQPTQPGNCDGVQLGDEKTGTTYATQVGAYNPIYYYIVGWPSLFITGNAAVYAMRIMGALLAAALIACAFRYSLLSRCSWLPASVAFILAPMNMFLIGAVNPNGAEIAAGAAFWISSLVLFTTPITGRERVWLWATVVVSGVLLANARALGPLWVGFIVVVVVIVAGWRSTRHMFTRRSSWVPIGILAAGGVFSCAWTVIGGSLSAQAEPNDAPLVGGSFASGFAYMLKATPNFIIQAVGVFGWLDTALVPTLYWVYAAAVGALVVWAFVTASRRSAIILALLSLAVVLLPALIQARSVSQTGIIWQGRYGTVLYLGVVIVAAYFAGRPRVLSPTVDASGLQVSAVGAGSPWSVERYTQRATAWVASLVAAFGCVAFVHTLHRYVVGADGMVGKMFRAPLWQPPGGWMALSALYLVVSVVAVIVLARSVTLAQRSATEASVP